MMRRLIPLTCLALFGACDDGGDGTRAVVDAAVDMPAPPPPTCAPPQAITGDCPEGAAAEAPVLVVSSLVFGQVDPETGTAPGFDLDGVVSGTDDDASCRQRDFVSADGREGIDNQLASLWPAIEAVTGDAVGGLIQGAINNGDLLIGFGVSVDGDTVTVGVQGLEGAPLIGTDAQLLSNQTFVRDLAVAPVLATGARDGDWITAGPFDITLPLLILSFEVDLEIANAYLRLRVDAGGFAEGNLGGEISVDALADAVAGADIPRSLADFVRTTLQGRADLGYSEADGRCARLSAGLVIEAVPAWVTTW